MCLVGFREGSFGVCASRGFVGDALDKDIGTGSGEVDVDFNNFVKSNKKGLPGYSSQESVLQKYFTHYRTGML